MTTTTIEMTELQATLLHAVRVHAVAHYETDGWDYAVETYDAAELLELIGDAATAEAAIARVGEMMKMLSDHRRDIESTAW